MMEHLFLFPSLLTVYDCEDFHEIQSDLVQWIYKYQKLDEGRTLSNIGGWQSNNVVYTSDFEKYLNYMKIHLKNIVQSILSPDSKAELINVWININKKHDFNWNHVHPDSHLSGVFWIKCPENSGDLVFDSPHSFSDWKLYSSVKDDYKKSYFMRELVNLSPTEGTILVFPPNLRHGVSPNISDEDRISIAFNIKLH